MRSTLLPDSMLTESWISLVDSVDKVWDTLIDKKIQALSTIHYSHKITNKSQLIDYSSHEILDRSTLIQKIRSLGFDISVTNSVSTNSLYRMAATLGQQSRAKSSPTKIANYVNYVFNTKIHLSQVCTTDFITFEENIPRSNTKAANASKPYYPTFAYIVYIDKDHLAETDISSLISNLRKLLPVRISIYYVKVYKSNQAPTALTIPDQSVNQGAVFTLDVSPYFVDPNISDSLTYSVTGGPAGTSITGSIITTDAVIDLSTTSIVVYATDTGGLSIAQSFNLSVEAATIFAAPYLFSEYGEVANNSVIDYLHAVGGINAPAGATITVYRDTTVIGTTTANASGLWLLSDLAYTTSGSYAFTYTVTSTGFTGPSSLTTNTTIVAQALTGEDPYAHLVTTYLTGEGTPGAIVPTSYNSTNYPEDKAFLAFYRKKGGNTGYSSSGPMYYSAAGESRFGNTSFQVNGNGGRFTVGGTSLLDDLGNADWTIEFFVKINNFSYTTGAILLSSSNSLLDSYPIEIRIDTLGRLVASGEYPLGDSVNTSQSSAGPGSNSSQVGHWDITSQYYFPRYTWVYVKAYRIVDTIYLQAGSQIVGSSNQIGTKPCSLNSFGQFSIGEYISSQTHYFYGNFCEFRITRGYARVGPEPVTRYITSYPTPQQVVVFQEGFDTGTNDALVGTTVDNPSSITWDNPVTPGSSVFTTLGGSALIGSGTSDLYNIAALLPSMVSLGGAWMLEIGLFLPTSVPAAAYLNTTEFQLNFDSTKSSYFGFKFTTSTGYPKLYAHTNIGGVSTLTETITQSTYSGNSAETGKAVLRIISCNNGKLLLQLNWGEAGWAREISGTSLAERIRVAPTTQFSVDLYQANQIWIEAYEQDLKIDYIYLQKFSYSPASLPTPILPPSTPDGTSNTLIIDMSFPSNPSSSGDPPILIADYGTAVVVNSTTNTIDYLTLASTPDSGLAYIIENGSWDISAGFKVSMNYKFIENLYWSNQSSVNTIVLQTSSSNAGLTLGFYFYRDSTSGLITAQRINFGGNYGPTFLDIPPVTSSTLFNGNPHLLDIYVTPTSVTIQVDHLTIQTTSISATPITEVATTAGIRFSTGGGEGTLPTGSSLSKYIVVTTPT